MLNTLVNISSVSVGTVHTHTHTQGILIKTKRVAIDATLYCVQNRLTVGLFKNK